MEFEETEIKGMKLVHSFIANDNRGYFANIMSVIFLRIMELH